MGGAALIEILTENTIHSDIGFRLYNQILLNEKVKDNLIYFVGFKP
jgi:hypothetical protein